MIHVNPDTKLSWRETSRWAGFADAARAAAAEGEAARAATGKHKPKMNQQNKRLSGNAQARRCLGIATVVAAMTLRLLGCFS